MRERVAAYIAAAALLAAWGLRNATSSHGPAVLVDSVQYLAAAASLRAEGRFASPVLGFDEPGTSRPLTHFPPLYPALVAAASADPLQGARRLSVLLFALNIAGIAALAWKAGGTARGAAAAAAAAASASLWRLHGAALSEPLLFLFELGLAAALLGPRSLSAAAWAGACAGLAALDRYAGVSLAVAGAAWLILEKRPRKHLLAFAAASLAPLAAWLLRNEWASGQPVDRHLRLSFAVLHRVGDAFRVFVGWLAPAPAPVLLAPALAALAAAIVLLGRAPAGPRWRLLRLTGVLVASYAAVLAGSSLLLDPHIPLDDRLLSPILVLLIPAVAAAAGGPAAPYFLAAWLAVQCVGAAAVGRELRAGGGYQAPEWRGSALIESLRSVRGEVYSNVPDALSFHLKRTTRWTPPPQSEAMARFAAGLREDDRVALFDKTWWPQGTAPEGRLAADAGLEKLADFPDGRLYKRRAR